MREGGRDKGEWVRARKEGMERGGGRKVQRTDLDKQAWDGEETGGGEEGGCPQVSDGGPAPLGREGGREGGRKEGVNAIYHRLPLDGITQLEAREGGRVEGGREGRGEGATYMLRDKSHWSTGPGGSHLPDEALDTHGSAGHGGGNELGEGGKEGGREGGKQG